MLWGGGGGGWVLKIIKSHMEVGVCVCVCVLVPGGPYILPHSSEQGLFEKALGCLSEKLLTEELLLLGLKTSEGPLDVGAPHLGAPSGAWFKY